MSNTQIDPFGFWRDMLGQWERSANAMANTAMASDEASRAANALSAVALRMQESTHEVVAASLRAMNLPSREDVLALNDRLARIEAQIAALCAQIAAMNTQAGGQTGAGTDPTGDTPAARPARTRKPEG